MNDRLSAIAGFYLAWAALIPGVAAAQTPSPPPDPPGTSVAAQRPPLGSSLTVDALGTLPAAASIFGLLDTAIPDVISDRIDTGGLSAGEAARTGAHGSTWTQTIYALGDADITDPSGSGTPLLVPGVSEWDRVNVSTGIMPVDASAPGMAVALVPRTPQSTWARSLDLFGSPAFLNAEGSTSGVPSIVRIRTWLHGNLTAGGPAVRDRLGVFASVFWTRSSHLERQNVQTLDANLASAFLTLAATPSSSQRVRLTGWAQRMRDPLAHHAAFGDLTAAERDNGVHAQAAWEGTSDHNAFRAFGSISRRNRLTELKRSPFVVIERLHDGPVTSLLDPGDGLDRLIDVGARYIGTSDAVSGTHHAIVAGGNYTHALSTLQSAFTGRVGERVNGLPARIWNLTDPVAPSRWSSSTMNLFLADTASLGRLTLNGGVRFEAIRGYVGQDATAAAVSWQSIYPRAGLHVDIVDYWNIAGFVQYGRYGHRLPLRDLAWGDPTAPTGTVNRWLSGNTLETLAIGPLVQRIGPGTGGATNFSTIDPKLKRPAMDEMLFGFESRPHPTAFVRMAAIARRESPLIGVVDVGVPESTYTTIGVFDTGIDRIGDQDDQTLIFYNRSPSTFGADRYLLTNPDDHVATFVGVDFVGEVHASRLFLIAGGTAGRSEGLSGNRGFGPLENDAAVLGEVFIDPNARGHAQGRVFTERGYTIKTAMSYRFDHGFSAALVGRYQDGQHFARMVVLPGLNQGPEAVRAFRNGRTRFTFSMTVDARLQKEFTIGTGRFSLVADAYNVFNQALSVEEAEVTGAGERRTTAVQPPRVIHLGVRIPF